MRDSSPYEIVLALDHAATGFHEAALALMRIQSLLGAVQLKRLDLMYAPPERLLCVLRLDPRAAPQEAAMVIAAEAASGLFRTLDLMHLTLREREQFHGEYLASFSERHEDVRNLPLVLQHLSNRLDEEVQDRPLPWGGFELQASFGEGAETQQGVASRVSSGGAFVASKTVPDIGTMISLSLGSVPFVAPAQVIYVPKKGLTGFGAAFLLDTDDIHRLESFLIAAARGAQWPERSGRLFERFPLRVEVSYEYRGKPRVDLTVDISRGGLGIESPEPPAVGAALRLLLRAPNGQPVELLGRVVRQLTTRPGAGIELTERPAVVATKIGKLLGTVATPATRRALVVDDDRFFRTVLVHGLRTAGYEVIEAQSGEEAMQRLLEQLLHLDVLLVDLHMPGLSGEQLIEKVRKVGREVNFAILVLTGAEVTEADRVRLLQLGADDVVQKSDRPEHLLERLEQVRRRRKLWLANPAGLVVEALKLEEKLKTGALSDTDGARLTELRSKLADDAAHGVVRRERRKHLRLQLLAHAQVSRGRGAEMVQCWELSIGGAFLALSPAPPFGTSLELLTLRHEDETFRLDVSCEVTECYDAELDGMSGVRVQFAELDAEKRATVQRVFSRLMERVKRE